MALFGVQLLQVVPHRKICVVYIIQALCMLLVCLAQFFNKMIITSLLLSFIPAALLVMALQGQLSQQPCGLKMRLLRMLGYIALVFALMAAINKFMKILLWHEADEHINKFVRAKFGLEDSIDFHVGLYLCSDGFGWLDWSSIVRLMQTLNLPLYLITHLVCLTALGIALVQQHSHGLSNCYLNTILQTWHNCYSHNFFPVFCAFLGALAVTTLRMKFIWAPYICLFASVCVSDSAAYQWLLHRFMKITGMKVSSGWMPNGGPFH
ncbi:hypothetical protein NP493_225g02009 [Ridgeia piscesae]|uniref:Uncharacterized protein n=1 Tax=Ridgeia piscesae TaxID=27915 RepID=A0AAD9P062_RIDPI|nr:hypothetical protein NP493_225g02009 [Ridgeia piscesae]